MTAQATARALGIDRNLTRLDRVSQHATRLLSAAHAPLFVRATLTDHVVWLDLHEDGRWADTTALPHPALPAQIEAWIRSAHTRWRATLAALAAEETS